MSKPTKKSQVYISHLAQDLAPGLSRADFYRIAFATQQRTKLHALSVLVTAFVRSHPCRILQAFPVQSVEEGYERVTNGAFTCDYLYDNGLRLDLKVPTSPPNLELYIKVDATHSEPVELRFECQFRLAADSFDRVFRPALWTLPTQLTGSLHLKPIRSPLSSGPSTPKEEFNRQLWRATKRTRQPSCDNRAQLTEVAEEVQIADGEHEGNDQQVDAGKGQWNAPYTNRIQRLDGISAN